ncbi:MAG TPA: universal stress protein [Thermoleophilaceae bacterium]|nr:universal stress protein [Thermoleophilaceae bacterium]
MFGSVLAGTDGSPRAERAVEQAVDLANAQGASLVLVTAFPERETHWEPIQGSARVGRGDLRAVAEQVLMRAARHAEEQGVDVEFEARAGDPADVILDVATEREVDLIVIGNKGMAGAKRYLLGGVPNKISHHAPCSVMIVHTD